MGGGHGLDSYGLQSCRERGLNPGEKNYFGPPSKGSPAKNLYTKSERQTLSCKVTWVWSESVNLYSRQVMILARKTKTYATQSVPGPPSGPPVAVICTGFPPISSALLH